LEGDSICDGKRKGLVGGNLRIEKNLFNLATRGSGDSTGTCLFSVPEGDLCRGRHSDRNQNNKGGR